jgi:hypothetical protein
MLLRGVELDIRSTQTWVSLMEVSELGRREAVNLLSRVAVFLFEGGSRLEH